MRTLLVVSTAKTSRRAVKEIGRLEFTGLLASIMATTALGIDLMLPAFGDIREAFALPSDSTAVAGVVTAYFIGLAVAQIFWGPIADRYGRKVTLNAGLALYTAGALAAALAPSLAVLYGARFIWGLGAAGPRVMALAVVRDRYEGDEMARMMSFIMAIFVVIPIIAPSLGAAILAFASWRWVFAFGAIYAGIVAVWARRLPETLRPEHRLELGFGRVRRAAGFVITNRQTFGYTVVLTLLFGVFSSWLASSELIFGDVFGRADLFPIIFGAVAAVMGAAMIANGMVVRRLGVRRLVHGATLGFIATAAVLTYVVERADGRPSLAVFVVIAGVQLMWYSLMFPNINTVAMDPMGSVAGMAAAVIGLMSIAGGAMLGSILDRMFDGTVRPIAYGFLAAGVSSLVVMLMIERGRMFKPLRSMN